MITPILYDLTDRERMLLEAVIEEYIASYRPVGSSLLHSKYRLPYSTATIRQDLANLESRGLLTHPYTSSGRVPTDLGYRYYVDVILHSSNTMKQWDDQLIEELEDMSENIDSLMSATAAMLAKVTSLFGVVMISNVEQSILTDIELISLSSDRVMMVLAMKSGMIKSVTLNLEVSVTPDQLQPIKSILKERLAGLSLEEIQRTINQRLADVDIVQHEIIQVLLEHSQDHFSIAGNIMLYTSPTNSLLKNPEFLEVETLQKTIMALDPSYIKRYLLDHIGPEKEYTYIGTENNDILLNHCSLLASRFDSNQLSGQIALLGPTRLPYKEVKYILDLFVDFLPTMC